MDNLIPSVKVPTLGGYVSDSSLSALIENPPAELQKLGIGENILLEIIQKADTLDLSKLQATLRAAVSGKLLEIDLSSLKFNAPLDLANNQSYDVAARLISKNPQAFEIKILEIDGQKPESFVLSASADVFESDASANAGNKLEAALLTRLTTGNKLSPTTLEKVAQTEPSQPAVSAPTIVEDKTAQMTSVKILPMKLGNAIENALSQKDSSVKLPAPLLKALNEFELDVRLAPAAQQISSMQMRAPQTSALDKIISLLKTPVQENQTPEVAAKIFAAISDLPSQLLPATLKTPSGKSWPVLQTMLGDMLPEVSLKIPEESKLLLQIKSIKHRPNMDIAKISSPSLKEIITNLQKTQMSNLEQLILQKVPQNNEKMLSNILSFIKASQQQKVEHWLGDEAIKELKSQGREGAEVLEKLNHLVSGQTQENQNWRVIDIPFYGDNMLNRIRVAIKKMEEDERRKENKKSAKSAVRFVVDTSFTALGAFQFDGFSFIKDRRFDLIIRTEQNVGNDFCANLMRVFEKSLAEVDYHGNVKINVKENFIKICEDTPQNTTLENGILI